MTTRLFQHITTTRMSISVAVKQIALSTMLQSFLGIPEEWHFISLTYYTTDAQQWRGHTYTSHLMYTHTYTRINHTCIGIHLYRHTYTSIYSHCWTCATLTSWMLLSPPPNDVSLYRRRCPNVASTAKKVGGSPRRDTVNETAHTHTVGVRLVEVAHHGARFVVLECNPQSEWLLRLDVQTSPSFFSF